MTSQALEQVTRQVEANPERSSALILYGLVKSMDMEERGCVFALARLKELDAETRQLVYELMEFMAEGGTGGADWRAAVARMDQAMQA